MVFCYKLITDTPRRSGSVSPRKRSPTGRFGNVPNSISQLIGSFDYDASSEIFDSIPEREWRLLAALARKREENEERVELADQFHRMWQKEKQERKMVEAQTSHQYKRYLQGKRQQERSWHEYKRLQMDIDHQLKTRHLIDCIKHKEKRSTEILAWIDDKKTNDLIDKALEAEARALLAADRRNRIGQAQQWRRDVELADEQRKADEARIRRSALLRDASQRLAISNALNTWETSLLRQEVTAMETMRRAHHAAHAALTDARSAKLARAREARLKRARKLADVTAQMRDAIRASNSYSGN